MSTKSVSKKPRRRPSGEGVPASNTLYTCFSVDDVTVTRIAADPKYLDCLSTHERRVKLKGPVVYFPDQSPYIRISCRSWRTARKRFWERVANDRHTMHLDELYLKALFYFRKRRA